MHEDEKPWRSWTLPGSRPQCLQTTTAAAVTWAHINNKFMYFQATCPYPETGKKRFRASGSRAGHLSQSSASRMASINHWRPTEKKNIKTTNGCEIMKHLFMHKREGKQLFVVSCFQWLLGAPGRTRSSSSSGAEQSHSSLGKRTVKQGSLPRYCAQSEQRNSAGGGDQSTCGRYWGVCLVFMKKKSKDGP